MVEPLTERELEVLGLIAAGKPNREIADQLVVTLETVRSTPATSSASWAPQAVSRRYQKAGNSA
jgi:FixJ family two-component response regulator